MATVIDALIVTLGLDAKDFGAKSKSVDRSLKKTDDSARKLSKDFDAMGKQFGSALKSIRNQTVALFAVFTAGRGVKNFITDTINSSAALGRLSDNIGISVNKLRAYQIANEKAGGSQNGLINQLRESANAIAEMKTGVLNEGVANAFRFGLRSEDLKDAETYLKARADIVARFYEQDPAQAQLVARKMGLSDDAFEAIKGGSAALEEYVRQAQKMVSINEADAKASERLRRQIVDLKRSFSETAERVSFSLIPIFKRFGALFQKFSRLIGDNKGVIGEWANDAAMAIDEFSEAWKRGEFDEDIQTLKDLASAFMDVVRVVIQLVKWGWELVKVWNAGRKAIRRWGQQDYEEGANSLFMDTKPRGPDKYPADPRGVRKSGAKGSVPNSDNARYVFDRLKAAGYTDEQAAGVIGSLIQESNLDPGAKNPDSKMYGIMQWDTNRRNQFKKIIGRDIQGSSIKEQVDFMLWEAENTEKRGWSKVKQSKTSAEAADAHTRYVERPDLAGKWAANIQKRQANAEAVLAGVRTGNASKSVALANASARSGQKMGFVDRNRTMTSETNFNGGINVYSNAKDGAGLARDMLTQLKRHPIASQTNSGLS